MQIILDGLDEIEKDQCKPYTCRDIQCFGFVFYISILLTLLMLLITY